MKHHVTSIAIAIMSVGATSLLADTTELERLRDSYRAAVERVAQPLNQTYTAELGKLRDTFARAGNLDAASAVQAEIDATNRAVPVSKEAVPPLPSPNKGADKELRVSIPANDVHGYKIGPLKKGDVITLSYVGGGWKPMGKVASDRPDDPKPEKGEQSRLAIADGRYKTQAGPVLAVVPAGTASQPFSFTMNADVENVVLRINEDGNKYEDNPGSVTYKLQLTR